MKVLLIDDQWPEITLMFFHFNAEMFYALNEKEAITVLAEQSIDIILMDGNLGNGVYGADVVRRLRASGVTTKIVMFSSEEKYNQAGIAAGANGSWNKELGKKGLEETLLLALK